MANDLIKNYFGFNRQQRNGLYVLISLSFLLLIVRIIYPKLMSPGKIVIKDLALIERALDSNMSVSKKSGRRDHDAAQNTKTLFPFDPNTVSFNQLVSLGFSEKKAGTFLKFRSRGFVFREKKDLQKVYGISGQFYERLAPYISIPVKSGNLITVDPESPVTKPAQVQKTKAIIVELNSADSISLESISGIGPAFSKRILKYRRLLGGFTNAEQLKEVYGLDEEHYNKIRPSVSVEPSSIKKINLNTDDFKSINKHPYLGYERTKAIFNFRRKTPITPENLNEVLNDPGLCQKLMPYLAFD